MFVLKDAYTWNASQLKEEESMEQRWLSNYSVGRVANPRKSLQVARGKLWGWWKWQEIWLTYFDNSRSRLYFDRISKVWLKRSFSMSWTFKDSDWLTMTEPGVEEFLQKYASKLCHFHYELKPIMMGLYSYPVRCIRSNRIFWWK